MTEKRRILIMNDDGVKAPGIIRLAAAARAYGEVWVVAPEAQRSAASHSITLHDTIDVHEVKFPVEGVRAFAISGTPADCGRLGILHLLPEKPDLVFTGINDGYNAGTDAQYSGTLGAAFEGVFWGIKSIAFSEGKEAAELTDLYLDQMMKEAIETEVPEGCVLSINFPNCRPEECKGILRNRTLAKYSFYDDHYYPSPLPDGGIRYTVKGIFQEHEEEGTDLDALIKGYITVGIVRNLT